MERNRTIKQFQDDADINVLLMTTGTGAVGYETSFLTLFIRTTCLNE